MATNYTSLLGFALPTTGELDGTWGTVVNDSITQLVEDSVAGFATADVTSGNWTLTTTGSGAANQARCAILRPTGTPGVSRNIIAPSQSKAYIVDNQSDGSVVVKGSATTGTTILAGDRALVVWDGSDFVTVAEFAANGLLPVSKGGTGVSTITGIVKGSGTSAFTAATAGTDYVAPGTATTFTAKQTFNGTSSVISSVFANAAETVTTSGTGLSSTLNYDVTTQSIYYSTANATGNWTVNFRASSGSTLDSVMSTGQSVTAVVLATNGATAYYNNAVTIDGNSVTPKYQGGLAFSFGDASAVDAYTYTIVKTGAATFTVFASQTKFA